MPNTLPSINLAKDRQLPLSDKLMNWSLTIGRLIVILTEIIAISAFVYRFSLDEKLVNLHDMIKQKQNIVSILRNDEKKYRNLQDRLNLASSFSAKAAKTNQTIADIINLIPTQARISDIILNKDRVNISVDVTSVSLLENFINPLKGYSGIKSISVDNIENKPSVGLSVDITAMLK